MTTEELKSFLVNYPYACASLTSKALNTKIEELPCPHFFINDWLPDFWLNSLIEQIPPAKAFKRIKGGGNILNSNDISGYTWSIYYGLIQQILLQQLPRFVPWWHEIRAQVTQDIGSDQWDVVSEPNYICLADPKIGIPPHNDGESLILIAVTVLGYPNYTPAPVTNFYSESTPAEPTTFYPPARNSLLVFLNRSGFSKHGVAEEIKPNRITHIAGISAKKTDDTIPK